MNAVKLFCMDVWQRTRDAAMLILCLVFFFLLLKRAQLSSDIVFQAKQQITTHVIKSTAQMLAVVTVWIHRAHCSAICPLK